MRIVPLAVWTVSAFFVAGCQTFQELDAAAGEWAKDAKAERAATATHNDPAADPKTRCDLTVKDTIEVSTDVDTAYARLKRLFGYRSDTERGVDQGFGETYAGIRHETQPGIRYSMADWVNVQDGGQLRRGWLTTDVERNGPDAAIVYLDYCVGGYLGFKTDAGFKQRLRSQVQSMARG